MSIPVCLLFSGNVLPDQALDVPGFVRFGFQLVENVGFGARHDLYYNALAVGLVESLLRPFFFFAKFPCIKACLTQKLKERKQNRAVKEKPDL